MTLGRFIVLEGMDGAGTSTQANLLNNLLLKQGYKVLLGSEPTDGPIGSFIRDTLKKPMEDSPEFIAMLALAFAADRMNHVHNKILPGIKNHDFIILDRYVLSSIVYQGIKLSKTFIDEINRFALEPDLTIIIDIPVKVALERLSLRKKNKDFYETEENLTKIHQRYMSSLNIYKNTVIVDGKDNENSVLNHIVNAINNRWPKK